MTVESPLRREAHGGFGERPGEKAERLLRAAHGAEIADEATRCLAEAQGASDAFIGASDGSSRRC